jgi:hypothetical protein
MEAQTRMDRCPRHESNMRTRFRKPLLRFFGPPSTGGLRFLEFAGRDLGLVIASPKVVKDERRMGKKLDWDRTHREGRVAARGSHHSPSVEVRRPRVRDLTSVVFEVRARLSFIEAVASWGEALAAIDPRGLGASSVVEDSSRSSSWRRCRGTSAQRYDGHRGTTQAARRRRTQDRCERRNAE